MSIYTYAGNYDQQDGTTSLRVTSGDIPLGESGDFTDAEIALLSQKYFLIAGSVDISLGPGVYQLPPGETVGAEVETNPYANFPMNGVLSFNGRSGVVQLLEEDFPVEVVQDSRVTTKGDILVADVNGHLTRVGVGADGSYLTADSSQPEGVAWDTATIVANSTIGGATGFDQWAPTTNYPVNKFVTNNNAVFLSKATHTSGSSFPSPIAGSNWQLVGSANALYPLGTDGNENINIGSTMPNIIPGGTGVGAWGNIFLGGFTGGGGGGRPGSMINIGYGNVGIGNASLSAITGGFHNVAVGNATLSYSIAGFQNTALGEGALYRLGYSSGAVYVGNWASGTTYTINQVVTGSDSNKYVGLTTANIGHDPTTDGGVHWGVFTGVMYAGLWSNGTTYMVNQWVIGSDNSSYVSLAGGNVGHNPTTDGGVHWGALAVGNNNVGVGGNAGQWLDTGSANNTFVGSQSAGTGGAPGNQGNLGVASNNTGLGFASLESIISGSFNVALGTQALNQLTTATENVAVGHFALWSTNSNASVAVGYTAMQNNTTGSGVGIGFNAMNAQTTGTQNVAVGASAVATNQTATSLTGIGYHALQMATVGFQTAVGALSLSALTTGAGNTAVGYASGNLLTTGGSNSLFGRSSGAGLTTGQLNVMVGYQAGVTNVSANQSVVGQSNVMIGYQSGGGAWYVGTTATVDPSNSVAIGYLALVASYATAIGRGTSALANGSVAIGVDHTGTAATVASTNPATGQDYFVHGTVNHKHFIPGLPNADPHVAGQLWANAGIVTVSAG